MRAVSVDAGAAATHQAGQSVQQRAVGHQRVHQTRVLPIAGEPDHVHQVLVFQPEDTDTLFKSHLHSEKKNACSKPLGIPECPLNALMLLEMLEIEKLCWEKKEPPSLMKRVCDNK